MTARGAKQPRGPYASPRATAMFDATSDGYDDEEFREGTVEELARCLSGIEADGVLRHAILAMAERIEELEA